MTGTEPNRHAPAAGALALILGLALAAGAGCRGDDPPQLASTTQAAPALIAPDTITAPASALRMAVSDFLATAGASPSSEYSLARLDLDSDGNEDGLVLLTGTDWCGSSGCTLLIFHADERRYRLVAEISMVNGPVVVAGQTSNGWRDIHMPDPREDRTIALRYNGASYPTEAAGPAVASTVGDIVFEGEIGLF